MKGISDHHSSPSPSSSPVESDREKQYRRRQNQSRRSNQNPSGLMDWRATPEKIPAASTAAAFNSLPAMQANRAGLGVISRSCPLPATSPPIHPARGNRGYFDSHWPEAAVEEAIQKGRAFRAPFRVNVHNRLEAYCTIEGVPTDIFISGVVAQNRAIEGDVVAIMLDPVACWSRLRGPNVGNLTLADDSNSPLQFREMGDSNSAVRGQINANSENNPCGNELDSQYHENGNISEAVCRDTGNRPSTSKNRFGGCHSTTLENSNTGCAYDKGEAAREMARVCAAISSSPPKRPTGKVISIITRSPRRETIVGYLAAKQWLSEGGCHVNQINEQFLRKNMGPIELYDKEYIQLIPTNSKFPNMVVAFDSLPNSVKERLNNGDVTVESELVAARIDEWSEESLFPRVHVIHLLGRGGEIDPQIAAILFENSIRDANFPPESLDCLLDVPWEIPAEEFKIRKDLRNVCTFTIDPSSAFDLDDALSVEVISNEIFRVGIHIADVSYYVCPDTALDKEAQIRSTSVYILQNKLPMLPPELSEDLVSLNPGVDRLAFSIILDIDRSGNITDRWIGRSIVHSCCKLSYDLVQDIIDGLLGADRLNTSGISTPQLHGQFEWKDIIISLTNLHEISKVLRANRFEDGALWLENSKLSFLFDDFGIPYDSYLNENKESCSIVEEFMLLANRSAAEIISRVFPDSALLRRHPEPNPRKLREFKTFCRKHGFELDTSSSGQLHLSLSKIREMLKNDPVLFDILVSYASRPMQPAAYFCTGGLRGREADWAHYALSVPFYTHFTSPLRRYPDIIVHRTLYAALDAEEMYLTQIHTSLRANSGEALAIETAMRCFTGLNFNKDAVESKEGREALAAAAMKFKVLGTEALAEIAAYCNERKLASKHAEDAGEKLYLWALIKKKEVISEARVLGLGPRFMSIYITKLSIERRIYYEDIEGLSVDWLETTCTLILDFSKDKRLKRRCSPGKLRAIEDFALMVYPSLREEDNGSKEAGSILLLEPGGEQRTDPAFFPLVLQHLSSISVALYAIGGDDGPLDIGARLYMCSYLW